ncbi:outer membrane cobalamin receptor [Christiangramia gaetbulicola]|uniref:Outer membrane cobalamin receptor n=1 Tax=Christiangramia gaetbulicola TaxID=703340 RepID=A0A2T6AHS9_9FLAO|nr:TonB-dependent receptor [Christiangramia gaetbulicola]PTX43365.1 outer membrane cobalamin receptor [Christiangramia gaetbulicola]
MKAFLILLLFLKLTLCFSQTEISGMVTDRKGNPLQGANVYLENTYDGATTDEHGKFEFSTLSTGLQSIMVSFIAYESYKLESKVEEMNNLEIRLFEDVNSLDAVSLVAGSFSAGENSRVSVLKPLDVVTTAGVAGDFIGALQTLPGTQRVGEDGRLFVRGGTAEETQIFIDGLRVFQPYTASAANLPSRGRYSPFLFDGITFSTGAYSAEYGQALSSVLTLNTINEPVQDQTDISIMTVGGGIGHTKKWDSSSVSLNLTYINLKPYQELIPNNEGYNFQKPYESVAGETVYRRQFQNGLFKFYTAIEHTNFELFQPDENLKDTNLLDLGNTNLYSNASYHGHLGNGWQIMPGLSLSYSKNNIEIDETNIVDNEKAAHLKLKVSKKYNNRLKFYSGLEYLATDFKEDYTEDMVNIQSKFNNNIAAGFLESDINFGKKFALKPGLRFSYLQASESFILSPRLAMAWKVADHSQFSAAYGDFHQNGLPEYLKFRNDIAPEKASHYLLNYQFTRPGYTFRTEVYYKEYRDLIKFSNTEDFVYSDFSNSGEGYAKGIDLFYRDNKSIENLEYWFSYSYIDSKRDYRDFPEKATPNFVATHSASLVTKYWIEDLKSQLGFSYNYASGRPFEDPNTTGFLNEKTPDYHNLSFNIAYLISQQKILYFSVSNILGRDNIFGYQYSNTPGNDGTFSSRAIRQAADRFFFVGFFWTISTNKNTNQLDNL